MSPFCWVRLGIIHNCEAVKDHAVFDCSEDKSEYGWSAQKNPPFPSGIRFSEWLNGDKDQRFVWLNCCHNGNFEVGFKPDGCQTWVYGYNIA